MGFPHTQPAQPCPVTVAQANSAHSAHSDRLLTTTPNHHFSRWCNSRERYAFVIWINQRSGTGYRQPPCSHILSSSASSHWVSIHPLSLCWTSAGFLGFEKLCCSFWVNSRHVFCIRDRLLLKKLSLHLRVS